MTFARSLRGRLAIIAAIAIVVTGTIVLLFTYFMARSIMREQVYKSMESVVARARGEVEITVRNMDSGARALSVLPELSIAMQTTAGTNDRQAASERIKAILESPGAMTGNGGRVTIVAGDGTIVAASRPLEDGSNIPAVAIAGFTPGVSEMTFQVDAEGLLLTSTMPVTAGGKVTGLIVTQDRVPKLEELLANNSGLGSTGRIVLSDFVDKRTRVAWFHDNDNGTSSATRLVRLPADSTLPFVKAAKGEKGEEESKGLFGATVVSAYDYIPGIAWGVTATTDSSEAFGPVERLRNVTIMVIAVLLLGGGLLAFMISRSIWKPLKELQEGVKAVGAGDLSTRVEISSGTEVKELAEEFNSMSEKLKDSYENLERKVEERTAELKAANDRLHELDDLKSEFVSLASHALRSPLASMKMGVATVLREMVGPLNDEQKQMLDIAERNIDRLTDLTSELLDITKIEAGELELDPEAVDLYGLACEIVDGDELRAQQKGLRLEVMRPVGTVRVNCDRDRMYQLIQNLVSNGLQFTDEGQVIISLAQNDGRVSVKIADTGLGIEPEALPMIFDKWSKAYTDARSERRGTGLGLAICRGIVEAHGGNITIESEPGKGTVVCFTLPTHE